MVERALRTYKAIAYRIGQAEATIDLGELQLLRGFIERALQTFEEAIQIAHSLRNEFIGNKALLGLGIVHSKKVSYFKRETTNMKHKLGWKHSFLIPSIVP